MAVTTTYVVGDGEALNHVDMGKKFSKRFEIDTSDTNVASGEIVKLMEVPINLNIEDVIVDVTTAEGGTLTIDIGDYLIADDSAVDADGYHEFLNHFGSRGTRGRPQQDCCHPCF